MTLYLTGTISCAVSEELASLEAHLPDHIRLSRAEPGCLSFEVTQTADPRVWRLEESFVDRAAFETHQARTRASRWFAATATLARNFTLTDANPDAEAVK